VKKIRRGMIIIRGQLADDDLAAIDEALRIVFSL
jgi:hypothetical protein